MKKFYIFLVVAALVSAMSCTKEVNSDTVVEKETISVRLSPETKTALEGTKTVWLEGDQVSVTVGGSVIGTLDFVGEDLFEGDVEAGHDGTATLNYPAGVTSVPTTQKAVAGTFADEAALLEGTISMADLRAGNSAVLANKTALLEFSVAKDGDVTFEVGSTKYTVTGCETGATYYACVAPASSVSFVARIGGYLSKQAPSNVTFTANKIAELGALPAPEITSYALMGINADWSTGKAFYKDVDGCYLLKKVTFTNTTEFKFRGNNVWGRPITFEKGRWAYTYVFPHDNMSNIAGTYDIWVDPEKDAVCFVDVDNAKPAFNNQNKLVHILYEATENCGLYIQSPSTQVNDYNKSSAWGNYQKVYMNKTTSAAQNYCAFPLPSNVVGVSARFTIRVWGDKNKTYQMTINDDTPFWGNSDSGGYYALSSKIDIN